MVKEGLWNKEPLVKTWRRRRKHEDSWARTFQAGGMAPSPKVELVCHVEKQPRDQHGRRESGERGGQGSDELGT